MRAPRKVWETPCSHIVQKHVGLNEMRKSINNMDQHGRYPYLVASMEPEYNKIDSLNSVKGRYIGEYHGAYMALLSGML